MVIVSQHTNINFKFAQDVSEFQHKLLEWLEDAFRSDLSRPNTPAHG